MSDIDTQELAKITNEALKEAEQNLDRELAIEAQAIGNIKVTKTATRVAVEWEISAEQETEEDLNAVQIQDGAIRNGIEIPSNPFIDRAIKKAGLNG
jgi:hypothetical protein